MLQFVPETTIPFSLNFADILSQSLLFFLLPLKSCSASPLFSISKFVALTVQTLVSCTFLVPVSLED